MRGRQIKIVFFYSNQREKEFSNSSSNTSRLITNRDIFRVEINYIL